MTPVVLLTELKTFLEENTKDIILGVRHVKVRGEPSKGESAVSSRAAEVHLMRLPDKDAETQRIPYILLQFLTGKDEQTPGEQPDSQCSIRLVVATYSEDGGQGAADVLNILTRIRAALLKAGEIGRQFLLKKPLEYVVYPEDTAPYFFGEMLTLWEMPSIIQAFITKNDCYKLNLNKSSAKYAAFQKQGPSGYMLHSVGCPQPSAKVFLNSWNRPKIESACHGLIEPNGNVYQCMPWNYRGWHGGKGSKGSVNDTHLGFEMTEPDSIEYIKGAIFKDNDPVKTKAHVLGTYKTAVEFFAHLCKEHKRDPLKDGVILSHSEGCKRGIASNHADVEHLWSKFGLTMNQFRLDVKNAMDGTAATAPVQPPPTVSVIKKGDIVQFAGGNVYASANATQAAHARPASRCKVTQTYSGKHPYHLISQDGKGVHGWVDAACVTK